MHFELQVCSGHNCRRRAQFKGSKMSRPKSLLVSSMCRACRSTYTSQIRRGISSTASAFEPDNSTGRLARRFGIKDNEEKPPARIDPLSAFSEALTSSPPRPSPRPASLREAAKSDLGAYVDTSEPEQLNPRDGLPDLYQDEPYHINVYAHRHNTHITFTNPARNPILSFSCGNLGLRKSHRASYDASFQLAAYTFRKMAEKQWRMGGKNSKGAWIGLASIRRPAFSGNAGAGIEVILRGYGPGREAFQKALSGTEGKMIKPLICKVTDGTRLKFGGTRSPQVRRLG
jgi:small subunit ribosomal protein S11